MLANRSNYVLKSILEKIELPDGAYEKAENKTKALLNYKKALSLDSDFESAKQAILRINQ